MMPIHDLQVRMRELGRIRMGEQVPVPGKPGQTRPTRGTTFRLTSPQRTLIEQAAERYGGDVEPWDGGEGGRQWQVTIARDALPCHVPPQGPLSQWNELWSGGGCQRRCDGQTEVLTMRDCVCRERHKVLLDDSDEVDEVATRQAIREAAHLRKPDGCVPVTRLNVWLHELPGMGVWRLESHGYYAAVELAGVAQFLSAASAAGRSVPAVLRLTQRSSKRPGQPRRDYVVPALDITHAMGDLAAQLGVPLGAQAPALDRPAAPALEPGRRGTQRVPLRGDEPEPPPRAALAAGAPEQVGADEVVDVDPVAEPGGAPVVAGAPPMGGPEPEPEPAEPPRPITERERRGLMAQLAERGFGDDDARHELLRVVTRGATDSSAQLDVGQLAQVLTALDLIAYAQATMGDDGSGRRTLVRVSSDGEVTRKPIRLPLDVDKVQAHLATLPEPPNYSKRGSGAAGDGPELPPPPDDEWGT